MVGSAAGRVFVYADQESVFVYTTALFIIASIVIAFVTSLNVQGTIDASESQIAIGLLTFITVYVTLSHSITTTSRHLENVVSDVAMLQASNLQNQMQFEMNRLTPMMSVLSSLSSANPKGMTERTLLDIASVVLLDASSVGLVYYGEEKTGHFYGVSTKSTGNKENSGMQYITSNVNTSYKSTAFSLDALHYKENGIEKRKYTVNRTHPVSQDQQTYDPRARPWYKLAMAHYKNKSTNAIWSPVYTFFGGTNLDGGLGQL